MADNNNKINEGKVVAPKVPRPDNNNSNNKDGQH